MSNNCAHPCTTGHALLRRVRQVSVDLREKLKRSTEDIQTLNRTITEQLEQIADLQLRQELHDTPAEMTQVMRASTM